jgi:hypothetical protein
LSFHNFDFAPGKKFVQKKSPRLLLREAEQRAEINQPHRGDIFVASASQNISQLRQERHIPSLWEFTLQRVRHRHKLKSELEPDDVATELVISTKRKTTNRPRRRRFV